MQAGWLPGQPPVQLWAPSLTSFAGDTVPPGLSRPAGDVRASSCVAPGERTPDAVPDAPDRTGDPEPGLLAGRPRSPAVAAAASVARLGAPAPRSAASRLHEQRPHRTCSQAPAWLPPPPLMHRSESGAAISLPEERPPRSQETRGAGPAGTEGLGPAAPCTDQGPWVRFAPRPPVLPPRLRIRPPAPPGSPLSFPFTHTGCPCDVFPPTQGAGQMLRREPTQAGGEDRAADGQTDRLKSRGNPDSASYQPRGPAAQSPVGSPVCSPGVGGALVSAG